MTSASYLSKLDINLQELNPLNQIRTLVNLHIDDQTQDKNISQANSNYSNTLQLSRNEHVAYHFAFDYSVLILYSLSDAITGKTIVIHLPTSTLNKHYTFTIKEVDNKLTMDLILKNGVYLNVFVPVEFLFSRTSKLPFEWFKVLNPYDFSVRLPHYLYAVSSSFSVVFLNDGGLLGLKKNILEDGNHELQPILFNDNSYLQSFTRFFVPKRQDSRYTNVVSCTVFEERYLLTLTQNCRLKVWDLRNYSVVLEQELCTDEKHANRIYDSLGQFMSLYHNFLAIYLPFGNGAFQILQLRVDANEQLVLNPSELILTNLSSSSIWSLVDIKLTAPLDLNLPASFINLIVLWKSNTITKLQVLNFESDDLDVHQWIEASNKSLLDIQADQDLLTDGNTSQALQNLKSHYTPMVFSKAQEILSKNGILLSKDEPNNQEYLTNLESVLKDLKKHYDEPSSLTLYQNELIMVNSLHLYNHSLYKINFTLENVYYNMGHESMTDELGKYLQIVDGFACTLATHTMNNVSHAFLDIINQEIPKDMPPRDKFTHVFTTCLEDQFQINNLKKLFSELSSLDVIGILNNLIENHLKGSPCNGTALVESIMFDNFSSVAILESLHQTILIQKKFVLQTLLTFAFLDFDYATFQVQLDFLLQLHYNQSLWIKLYQLDKPLLISEVLTLTSKFGYGIKLASYAEWSIFLNGVLGKISEMPVLRNPLFLQGFDKYVLSNTKNMRDPKMFLQFLQRTFYIREDMLHEFMMGLSLYVSGFYEDAYKFLTKSNYPETIPQDSPPCLSRLVNKSHPLSKLIESMTLENKEPAYYFYLSHLFSDASAHVYALRSIKRSIKLSTSSGIEESNVFKVAQLTQYLNTLIIFADFQEVLDVLKISHETLNDEVRTKYYKDLLTNIQYNEQFVSTLLNICSEQTAKGLFLTMEDFAIIDQILLEQVDPSDWSTYKKLFSFRFINQHERTAVEILYNYILHGHDIETKRKCYLIIINVLASFSDEKDQWILVKNHKNGLLTLQDLKFELSAL